MQIKNFKLINSGCLKSSFTVVKPEWAQQEFDCKLFEKDDGSYWINFCDREYVSKEGKKKSWNQLRWPKEEQEKLSATIKSKLDEMVELPF